MELSRHDSPVVDYGDMNGDEDWESDNGVTTKSTIKDVSGDRSAAKDTDQTMAAKKTVEIGSDETANRSTDATIGVGINGSRNGANDAHKRTVADPGQASSSTLYSTGVGIVVTRSRSAELQQ